MNRHASRITQRKNTRHIRHSGGTRLGLLAWCMATAAAAAALTTAKDATVADSCKSSAASTAYRFVAIVSVFVYARMCVSSVCLDAFVVGWSPGYQ